MKIKQFAYSHEIYGTIFGYLLYSGTTGIVIDPDAYEEIDSYCKEAGIEIAAITNTHMHDDHTVGNDFFTKEKKVPFINPKEAAETGTINIGDEKISVKLLPGHSMDSVVFMCDDILVSGDTLFNGTVGNCYTGNYEEYFKSLLYLMTLPDETRVYAGHDLVEYSCGVARGIEPDNPAIDEYQNMYNPWDVHSTIGWEKKVNPFVRWNDTSLDSFRQGLNTPLNTPYERFMAMMSVH